MTEWPCKAWAQGDGALCTQAVSWFPQTENTKCPGLPLLHTFQAGFHHLQQVTDNPWINYCPVTCPELPHCSFNPLLPAHPPTAASTGEEGWSTILQQALELQRWVHSKRFFCLSSYSRERKRRLERPRRGTGNSFLCLKQSYSKHMAQRWIKYQYVTKVLVSRSVTPI